MRETGRRLQTIDDSPLYTIELLVADVEVVLARLVRSIHGEQFSEGEEGSDATQGGTHGGGSGRREKLRGSRRQSRLMTLSVHLSL